MESIEVRVEYFASLREKSGKESEVIQGSFTTYSDLYRFIQEKYNFELPESMMQVAVDDQYCLLNKKVTNGARVVFIPPIAGG